MNKVILMGRLTKDPEQRRTQTDIHVTTFTLAVDRRFAKQGEEKQTDFLNIVTWRTTAEFVAKYFSKGQQMCLVGNIQTRTYQDADGKTRYVTEIVADEVYFAGEKKQKAQTEDTQEYNFDDFTVDTSNEDELPF